MITGSVVLYHSNPKDIDTVIKSFHPQDDRLLYLIDNSEEKTDRYLDLPYVTYIHTGKNNGYGFGHNIGIEKAIEVNSTYHIVLNPDLEFEPSILDELVTYADNNSDVVYILPKVHYPDGSLQYLCKLLPTPFDLIFRRFLPNKGIFAKHNDTYILKQSGYNQIMNPPCLSGCFMFMRTETLKANNLRFDERFFMYCEDFDLMRRLHRVGKTIFYPNVSIIHHHAQSSYQSKKMLLIHIQSACKYFNKYGWFIDSERKIMNQKILEELSKND